MKYETNEAEKMKTSKYQLYAELQSIADQGIILFLDGNPSTPEFVTYTICANEDSDYMRDYIYDEEGGRIRELHFDKINSI